MRSDEFKWIIDPDGYEWFQDGNSRYDVQVAKQIIKDNPREVVRVPVCDHTLDLEPDEQDHTVDLDVPIILATKPDGVLFVIDGLHRISKAMFYQWATLPAVVLTPEETDRASFGSL